MNYAQDNEFMRTAAALRINELARKLIQTIGKCHCGDTLDLINSVCLLIVILY